MAVRTIKTCLCALLLLVLVVQHGYGCFGPKLFVGVSSGPEHEVLYALVTLYVKEKTGVESTLVEVAEGKAPLALIREEKADMVFVPPGESSQDTVFMVDGLPALVTGKRPLEELQFTTVLPAVKKLNRLLTRADVESLVVKVNEGESAMAVARKFFMERRWI